MSQKCFLLLVLAHRTFVVEFLRDVVVKLRGKGRKEEEEKKMNEVVTTPMQK